MPALAKSHGTRVALTRGFPDQLRQLIGADPMTLLGQRSRIQRQLKLHRFETTKFARIDSQPNVPRAIRPTLYTIH